MVSPILNWTALGIHFLLTWAIYEDNVMCLVHCIKFDSWKKCEDHPIEEFLSCSAFYGLSGFLWVLGNFREYHILYLWLIITAQLIGCTFALMVYAHKLVGYSLWQEYLVLPVFLVISFVLVLIHLLVAKEIITNRWIKGFIIGCMSLSGKIGFG